jgi:hypothetical protein
MEPSLTYLACLLIVFLGGVSGHQAATMRTQDVDGATRLAPSISTSKNTKYVSCWKGQAAISSRLVKSPILVSPDGSRRVYVEVEAAAFRPKDVSTYAGPHCQNTSRIFLGGSQDAEFKLAYTQSASFSDGNSLKLVDWSPDGMNVLMERTSWPYESEGYFTDVLEFNVASGEVRAPDLSKILEARFGKDCGFENSVVGFTAGGDVIIAVRPLAESIYTDGATSCVKQRILVTLSANNQLQSISKDLPPSFPVVRYGKFPERQPTRK